MLMIWHVTWRTFQLDKSSQCPRIAVQVCESFAKEIALQFVAVWWKITMHDKK